MSETRHGGRIMKFIVRGKEFTDCVEAFEYAETLVGDVLIEDFDEDGIFMGGTYLIDTAKLED